MVKRFSMLDYLKAPVFEEDEEKTRVASVLNVLQLALFTVTLLGGVAILFVFTHKLGSLSIAVGLLAALGASRFLMYQGHVRAASITVVAGLWLMMTILLALGGGMQSIDFVQYVALTVIAGLLLGPQASTLIACANSLVGLAFVLAHTWGYPLPQIFPNLPLSNWIKFIFALSMAVITLNIALRNLRDALRLAQRHLEEREQAEIALRNSEDKYRHLFEMESDAIFLIDNEQGRILEVNAAASALYGYSREALLQMRNVELSAEPEETRAATTSLRSSLVPVRYHRKKDGTVFSVEITGSFFNWRGREVHIAAIRDITERKQVEQERERLLARIREQADQMRQIMNVVPEGVLLLDAEGQVIMANPQAEKELEALARAQVGDQLTHLGERPLSEFLDVPPSGFWHEATLDARRFQIVARSVEYGPASRGWVMIIRDVTQQYEAERRAQQQERLVALGQLAAGIAHDFNNIMSAIVLYAQMSARAAGVPPEIRERLITIQQQAGHATTLIQQILDFSRRAVFERQPLDVLPLLREQVKILERTLPENIQVTLEYGLDDYVIKGSPTYVQQVLMNLAVNARDAMPEGGELHFALSRVWVQEKGAGPLASLGIGDWVVLAVADTGMGISPEVLPHIFDPFFTTKAPGKGTGLGLAQVYGIVSMHEGDVDVKTSLEGGTTFYVYLPALPAASSTASETEDGYLTLGERQTILVVEDNAATRLALVESLDMLNYQTRVAKHGLEALDILTQNPDEIALVLSDVVMPELGGIALLRALKARAIHVPVILLTGHPLREELESLKGEAAACLLADWIRKPPDLETLSAVIARALE